ncbi:uncharacterized protein LOC121859595 [Homarus americanus]|uniref:uncharacterized protein LOC121859595 n=1 Tax=Homarus americanus TaxID=6706 RepID=UPI001C47D490|nr:uncharacterized protein LOC121859595 [Homarus americanus]
MTHNRESMQRALDVISETWTPYRRHIQMLVNFHTRCLKRIFGISWEDRVTREELYRRSNTTSIETMLAKRHLCWLGHVIRMPDHRLPRQILYGKLSHGNRSVGGQEKRYKDHSKLFSSAVIYNQIHWSN